MRFSKSDFVPRLMDAGLDETILTSFSSSIQVPALTEIINEATGLELGDADVVHYISERGGLGLTATGGSLRGETARLGAPGGVAADSEGIWFDVPSEGDRIVRWYVNGEMKVEELRDLAVNRYMALGDIGATQGDIVQTALIENDVCGWWSRIQI